MRLHEDLRSILLDETRIRCIVSDLGDRITSDYSDKNLLILGLLKGSFIFLADLIRAVRLPCRVEFVTASSYGDGTRTSGVVDVFHSPALMVRGYDVLVVEDIIDSGVTLSKILETLRSMEPASVRLCTLLDKPAGRRL